jgi:IS605 OrfB family transposase
VNLPEWAHSEPGAEGRRVRAAQFRPAGRGGGGERPVPRWRMRALRPVAGPFVVAAPAGARVRARLRVSAQDQAVLRAVGSHLGSLAAGDLAVRCAEGRLDARSRAVSRARRKRALTAESSSRWAGAITRTSEDQWQRAERNLRAARSSLQARIRTIRARLAVPAGDTAGRARGYATAAERHAKAVRLQSLTARLTAVDRRLEAGAVSVVRGGRPLLRKRGHLAAAGLTEAQWRGQWESARLFLTADGERDKAWGNETIRWNPEQGWLEVKLPAPLAHLSNRPHGRYRLSCAVEFSYRGDEVAAQAATGAVRYDISHDPARDRWYLDASWRTSPGPAPALADLRQAPVLAVDLNHGHLDGWTVTPDGNPAGPPVTILAELSGLPASQRDGQLRAAISELLGVARQQGCQAVVIEDLDFGDAREQGRERHGSRPSRGRRGRAFRRLTSGIPTGKFRDRLTQMASNAGLAVIAVDPAYTSRWGREHWLAPLQGQASPAASVAVHHAAAVVIGRRALGHRARRKAGVTGGGQRTGRRRAAPGAPVARRADRNGRPRKAQRQPPPWRKTATATRTRPPDQAAQDRPEPPATQDHVLLAQ